MKKHIRLMGLFVALAIVMMFCPNSLATNTVITCDLQFDKTSVNTNEAITATYNVTGGFLPYKSVEYSWDVWSANGNGGPGGTSGACNSMGQSSFTPRFGATLSFSIYVEDAIGQFEAFHIDAPITGGSSNPIICTMSFDKGSVSIGESITATHNVIGGNLPYKSVEYSWDVWSANGNGGPGGISGACNSMGQSSFTPRFGATLSYSIYVEDAIGQYEAFHIDAPITGGSSNPIICAMSFDKGSVSIGESITATHNVTGGNLPYKSVEYSWDVWSANGNGGPGGTSGACNSMGQSSFTPRFGATLSYSIYVEDAIGQFEAFHIDAPITGTPLLAFLPESQSVWRQNSSNPLTTVIEQDISNFLCLAMDQQLLDISEYSLSVGSTIIEVSPSYLNALMPGKHVLTAYFTTGHADLAITVVATDEAVDVPSTGDSTPIALLIGIVICSGVSLLILQRRHRKTAVSK